MNRKIQVLTSDAPFRKAFSFLPNSCPWKYYKVKFVCYRQMVRRMFFSQAFVLVDIGQYVYIPWWPETVTVVLVRRTKLSRLSVALVFFLGQFVFLIIFFAVRIQFLSLSKIDVNMFL